ncbi:hypothetical protein FRB99_008082 [Tulasnella sp. 403]|nr:hypothetical protein FRB99_008082 [Tulasnella sp. 403]
MPERPKHLSGKQALAAIGQGRLIALWDNLFGQLGQPIAQILLTRGDISDRSRYLNAVNTLTELLSMGVVPIINENDTVSVSEIRFGDNDTLSAITSSMLHADYLFLLTDVDCLYTSNPRKDPNAKPIEEVTSVSAIREKVSTATLGSHLGTGGMETKLIAAEIATAAGVSVVITSSRRPENIFDIIQFNVKTLPLRLPISGSSSTIGTSHSLPGSPSSTPLERQATAKTARSAVASQTATGANTPIRPPHTLFRPSINPLPDLKSWTAHTLTPSGGVVIDDGAHHVLSRRESGGRLLAVGVLAVIGTFAAGQAVRIVVKRKKTVDVVATASVIVTEDGEGDVVATTTLAAAEGNVQPGPDAIGSPVSVPDSPNLYPLNSLSSSMSSLDPLSRVASLTNVMDTLVSPLKRVYPSPLTLVDTVDDEPRTDKTPRVFATATPPDDDPEKWEVVEVGRGLANYNSAEIMKIRGVKSTQIRQLIGYADSEYVVENITIRLTPLNI